MKTKRQLNKEIKDLELQIHTKKYIHIPRPSWIGIGKFSLMIVCAFLSYLNFLLILRIWKDYNLGYVFAIEEEWTIYTPKFIDLIILYPIIGQFILVSLTTILIVSLFKKLKSYNKEGIFSSLIFGLIGGLIFGLIFGLMIGLISGLIFGLIGGLVIGLIIGLVEEFD